MKAGEKLKKQINTMWSVGDSRKLSLIIGCSNTTIDKIIKGIKKDGGENHELKRSLWLKISEYYSNAYDEVKYFL